MRIVERWSTTDLTGEKPLAVLSPDRRRVLTSSPADPGDRDCRVAEVRDARTGDVVHTIPCASIPSAAAWGPSGDVVYLGFRNGHVGRYPLEQRSLALSELALRGWVVHLAVAPIGEVVYAAAMGRAELQAFDATSLERTETLRPDGFQGGRHSFVVRDDGALITRTEPGLVTPEGTWVHDGHYYDTLTRDGRWLTACNAQHGTHVWDLATGSVVAELPDARIERAVASPDGRWVFGVDRRGRVCAWERGLPACRAAVDVEPEGQASHNQVVCLGPDRILVACRHGLLVLDTSDLAETRVDGDGAPVRDLDGPEALAGLARPDLEQALFQWLSPLFPAALGPDLREVTALAREASMVDGELVVVFEAEDVDFRFAGPYAGPWATGDEALDHDPLGAVLRAFAGCRFDPDERRDFAGTLAPYGPDGFLPLAALPPDQTPQHVVVLAFDHSAWAFDRSGSCALVEVLDGHGVHPDSDRVPAPELLLRCMRHHLCL